MTGSINIQPGWGLIIIGLFFAYIGWRFHAQSYALAVLTKAFPKNKLKKIWINESITRMSISIAIGFCAGILILIGIFILKGDFGKISGEKNHLTPPAPVEETIDNNCFPKSRDS